ncbi:MAG TPA: hypothetical protein VF746_07360 [Longimicrobium sp.]|jgi:hypothetical protein
MRKLTLSLDALHVDSFDTGTVPGPGGTVRGHDSRITEFCNTRSCLPCQIVVLADDPEKPAE